MNFTRDVVEAAPPNARALVELTRDGRRREYTFGALGGAAARLAGTLDALGVRRGDVVLTLVGNRLEWALTMLACFRQGFVVLPCTEQLRPKDLAQRLAVAQPRLVVADARNAATLQRGRLVRRDALGAVRDGGGAHRRRTPSSRPRTRA